MGKEGLFMRFLGLLSAVIVLNCSNSKEGLFSEKNALFLRAGTASVSGKVMKGAIRNGTVSIYALNKDGTCNTGAGALTVTSTDTDGNYRAYFPKTGKPVCLIATPKTDTKMYDEATKADISWTGSVSMTMILKEPIGGASKSGLNLTPLSRFAAARLQSIAKNNSTGSRLDEQVTFSNKQIAVQFGLHKGFTKKNASVRADSSTIDLDSIPDILDAGINLDSTTDSNTKYVKALLGGFSVIAKNSKKAESNLSSDDTEKVMQAFEKDFADGNADGKNITGEAIIIQNGAALGSSPLTSTLQSAISSYIASDSSLGLTASDTASLGFVQSPVFLQNVPTAPYGLTYAGSSFAFSQNYAVTALTPSFSGTLTECTASPSLPAGLKLDNTTCVISGTPTAAQSETSYTVTAANVYGFSEAKIKLTVLSTAPTVISYSGSPFSFTKDVTAASASPTVSGTAPASFSIAPSLPSGLSFNAATGQISGTPATYVPASGWGTVKTYTVSTLNSTGSTTASTSLSIKINAFRPWSDVQPILNTQAGLGVSTTATVTTIGNVSGAASPRWQGGVMAPNGKIYGIPRTSSSVLKIDPSTDSVSLFGSVGAGGEKWWGGVLAPNGKIYGIPASDSNVLVINPANDTTYTFPAPSGTGYKWGGGVLAPNGKIYAMPCDDSRVLVIDPANDTTYTFGSLTGCISWGDAVLAPNGKIYSITGATVRVVDPSNDTAYTFGTLGGSAGSWSNSGVLAPNGKIYYMAHASASVLVVNPSNDTFYTFGSFGGTQKFTGGVLAPSGRIYGMPLASLQVLEINASNDSTSLLGSLLSLYKFNSGVLAPNGKIYGMSYDATYLLMIDTKSNGVWPSDFYLSPYFNKL